MTSRLPDFFIVGHAKCGTTALYEMLKRHPQVFMSDPKEPLFFARENPDPQTSDERSIEFTGRKRESLDDYLSLFAGARPDQRVGEASTAYLWSRSAPGRIAAMRPDARIVAMFREPASFLRSLHLQMLSTYTETERSLRKAIELEGPRRENRHIPRHTYWPQMLIYTDRVRYVEQLRRYHAVFPAEQVLVLLYEDFRDDNEATVRRVLRFLAVDDTIGIQTLKANPTVSIRSARLDGMVRAANQGHGSLARAVKTTARIAMPSERLRKDAFSLLRRRMVLTAPPPPDEGFMLELRRRFQPEVAALAEYLGRDLLSLWGYNDLD